MPYYSVIIPTYNRAKLLREALVSVEDQTVGDSEIIVIDNMSIDDTEKIIKEFPKIKYVRASNDGIIAKSRNIGLALATGEYIAFLDDDDIWYNEKIGICLDIMKKDGMQMVCHGMENRITGIKHIPYPEITYRRFLLHGNRDVALSSVVACASVFKGRAFITAPDIVGSEDFSLWLDITYPWGANKLTITGIRRVLGKYSPGGFSTQKVKDQICSEIAAYEHSFSVHGRPKDAERCLSLAYLRGAKRVGGSDIKLSADLVVKGLRGLI